MLTSKQESNYAAFQACLPEYLDDPLKVNKFAVFYDENLQGLFDTFQAAYRHVTSISAQDFIIQQIVNDNTAVNFLYPAVV
jgi:predicted ester cyclase